MAGTKEFVDKFTRNRCDFQGRVIEDPQLFDVEGGQGALLKIKTVVPEIGANGQWIDKVHIIPVYVMDSVKTEKVVKPYIKEGKQLLCDGCDSPSFKIRVLIEADLNVSVGIFTRELFVRDQDIKTISVIKVIQCATCGSEDFIKEERNIREKAMEK